MSFDRHIHLRDEINHEVQIYSSGEEAIGRGTLQISPSKLPYVEVHDGDMEAFKSSSTLRCQYQHQWFTLLNCQFLSYVVYPKAIVNGERDNCEFKKVSIVLQGVSDWMGTGQGTQVDGGVVSKSLNQRKFDVEVKNEKRGHIRISSENWWETSHPNEGCFQLNQYVLINYERLDRSIHIDEVIKAVHELNNLFSILLGYPLNIDYVLECQDDGKKRSIYIPTYRDIDSSYRSPVECFVNAGYLDCGDNWEKVFNCLYGEGSDSFSAIWSRLPNIFKGERTWHHDFLSHVTILDAYSSRYCKGIHNKISSNQFRKFRSSLRQKCRDVIASNRNDPSIMSVYLSIEKQLAGLRNSSHVVFRDRINTVNQDCHPDIISAIGISDDDWDNIKKLRDQIAHGATIKTKDHVNLNYESTLMAKLTILLLYWFYRDIGFPEKDIALFFQQTPHRTIANAELDSYFLNSITNSRYHCRLNKKDFKESSHLAHVTLFEIYGEDNEHKYLKSLSQEMSERWKNAVFSFEKRDLHEFIAHSISSEQYKTVTYIGSAYSSYESHHFDHFSVLLLNAPPEIRKGKRFCWYNEKSGEWEKNEATRFTT